MSAWRQGEEVVPRTSLVFVGEFLRRRQCLQILSARTDGP